MVFAGTQVIKLATRFISAAAAASIVLCAVNQPGFADTPWNYRSNDPHKPAYSDEQNQEFAYLPSEKLASEADSLLKTGQVDSAIRAVSELLARNEDVSEAHRIYAESLERKLNQHAGYDPSIFKQCVEEWLAFMRSQLNEEGRVSLGGVGVSNFLPGHDERYMIARQHLIDLTGVAPRPWESNQKYLKRALRSAKTTHSYTMMPGPGL